MDEPTRALINSGLRDWYEFRLPDDKDYILKSWQVIFGIRDIRNVQLWLTKAATRRDFLNRNLSSEEFEMRASFAKGILQMKPINSPQKIKEFVLDPIPAGRKMRDYLTDDFIQTSLKRVEFFDDRIVISYNMDSSNEGEIVTDEEVDEFA